VNHVCLLRAEVARRSGTGFWRRLSLTVEGLVERRRLVVSMNTRSSYVSRSRRWANSRLSTTSFKHAGRKARGRPAPFPASPCPAMPWLDRGDADRVCRCRRWRNPRQGSAALSEPLTNSRCSTVRNTVRSNAKPGSKARAGAQKPLQLTAGLQFLETPERRDHRGRRAPCG
jgi:hypothetical protein